MKLKAEEQTSYWSMYVYTSDVWRDLLEMVSEFMGENEDQGNEASCGETSPDTIEDISDWETKRKELLRRDFREYWGQWL